MGVLLCETAEMIAYGLLRCETSPISINSGSNLQILAGQALYDCDGPDYLKCKYEQQESAGFPSITSVTKTSSTVVF